MMQVERLEEVRDAAYYDKHYAEESPRSCTAFSMYPVWETVAGFIAGFADPKVLELGCGSGGLAQLLHDLGVTRYIGYDFSEEAIKRARERVNAKFVVADITRGEWASEDFNTVVAVEVLEHLADDIGLLRLLPVGTRILFSVPNLNCAGHVRWFGNPKQVADRYRGILEFQKTEIFVAGTAKWFVVHAIRKSNQPCSH